MYMCVCVCNYNHIMYRLYHEGGSNVCDYKGDSSVIHLGGEKFGILDSESVLEGFGADLYACIIRKLNPLFL